VVKGTFVGETSPTVCMGLLVLLLSFVCISVLSYSKWSKNLGLLDMSGRDVPLAALNFLTLCKRAIGANRRRQRDGHCRSWSADGFATAKGLRTLRLPGGGRRKIQNFGGKV